MSQKIHKKIYVIFGSTASGKTAYAIKLAKHIGNAEIINYDSMQVYSEIPILTAQPTSEEGIKHHLYGFRSILNHYCAGDFISDVKPILDDIAQRGMTAILVGGTGMYLSMLIDGDNGLPKSGDGTKKIVSDIIKINGINGAYNILWQIDPKYANKIHHNDIQRIRRALEVYYETSIPISECLGKNNPIKHFEADDFHIIWLQKDRDTLFKNINTRFDLMIQNGVVEEVLPLLNMKYSFPKAHGLNELMSYIIGDITLEEAAYIAKRNTRNYAKRQITWAKGQLCSKYNVEKLIDF